MKITECIQMLSNIQREHGDLDVVILTDTPDGEFCIDPDPDMDAIGVPQGDGSEMRVVAIAWRHCFDGDIDTEPLPPLRIVK